MLRSARQSRVLAQNLCKSPRPVAGDAKANVERLTPVYRLSCSWFSQWSRKPDQHELLRQGNLLGNSKVTGRAFASLPSHSKIDLPALSPTMKTGSVLTWEKQEGEQLNEGDLLCEIETDKATMGFETPEEGYLAKILIPAGTRDVPIGKLLCIIVENEADVAAFKNFSGDDAGSAEPAPAAPAPKPKPAPAPVAAAAPRPVSTPPPVAAAPSTSGRIIASPLAKKLAAERGVNLATVTGTGPNGRIIAKDVAGAPASSFGAAQITPGTAFTDLSLTGMRQTIARRLLESKQTIPHYYLQVDINVDEILKTRSKLNEILSEDGIKVSINDFVIKAAALACQRVPEVNSSWQGDFIRQYNTVDVNVAVSTDSGLIAPIVFQAERRGLKDIAACVRSLADKAKKGTLQPQEFQGGTFTVSNLGMFGVKSFSAVINPPQSCILAVGSVHKELTAHGAGGVKESNMLSVSLSCDHRVVDGAVGAKWLQIFKQYLENPVTMVL